MQYRKGIIALCLAAFSAGSQAVTVFVEDNVNPSGVSVGITTSGHIMTGARSDQRFTVDPDGPGGAGIITFNANVWTGIYNFGSTDSSTGRRDFLCVELTANAHNGSYSRFHNWGLMGFFANEMANIRTMSASDQKNYGTALQLAAWELVYDVYLPGVPLTLAQYQAMTNLGSGNFVYNHATSGNGAWILGQAQTYLAMAWTNQSSYWYYRSPSDQNPNGANYQDYISRASIPGPAAMLPFVAGLLGLKRRARR